MAKKSLKDRKGLIFFILMIATIVLAYNYTSFFDSRVGGKSIDDGEDGFDLRQFKEPNCTTFNSWGNPKIDDENLLNRSLYLCRQAYSVHYDAFTKSPIWISELMTKTNVTRKPPAGLKFTGVVKDPDIPKKMQVDLADYVGSNYIAGQIVPINNLYVYYSQLKKSENLELNQKSVNEGFYATNTLPMSKKFRDLYWEPLSSQLRISFGLNKTQSLNIISGPLYLDGNKKTIGGQLIPSHFFKIIVNPELSGSTSYIFPNNDSIVQYPMSTYIVPFKEIERLTGWKFFPKLAPFWAMKIKLNPDEYYKDKDE